MGKSNRDKTLQERYPNQYFNSPVGHIRDRIIIHQSNEIPREGIFISLNGFSFLAKAGVEIDLPRPVRQMLDTRIKTETLQGDDGKSYSKDIPRITYTLVKEGVNIPDPVLTPTGAGLTATAEAGAPEANKEI